MIDDDLQIFDLIFTNLLRHQKRHQFHYQCFLPGVTLRLFVFTLRFEEPGVNYSIIPKFVNLIRILFAAFSKLSAVFLIRPIHTTKFLSLNA